jgi:hypothetical protein
MVLNVLTFLVSLTWVASFIVRLYVPSFMGNAAVDSCMLLIIGYWFSVQASTKGKSNGHDKRA